MADLVGREAETATVDAIVTAARDGLGGALVLRGEPGIGKSALLAHAAETADGFRVLRIGGVEAERDMAFAGLHRLLTPLLDELGTVPVPQQQALNVAFGIEEGPPPDRLFVGLGALTLLSTQAASRPILCVVDDLQWLDEESARVLALVGRRLHADPVAMVFGMRTAAETTSAIEGLTILDVPGLPHTDAQAVLREAATHPIDDDVADWVTSECRGNPLALVEVATSLTRGQLAGTEVLPQPLPVGRELEAQYLRRVRDLPADAQLFLLVAAAEGSTDASVVREAADHLGLPSSAADVAEQSGFLDLEPILAFRHPLVRSAVYQGASSADRRRAHDALAAVGARAGEEHRRAWHRAAAAEQPDEDVARALEAVAARARRRGGDLAVAAFLSRAVEMTPDGGPRAARTLAVAEAELAAGAPARALRRIDALPAPLDDDVQVRAVRLRGACHLALGQTDEALPVLVESARALAARDPAAARETLLDAVSVAVFTGRRAAADTIDQIALEAVAIGFPAESDATAGDLLLHGLATLYTRGLRDAAPRLREALDVLAILDDEALDHPDTLRWIGFGCLAAGSLGDYDRVHALASRLVGAARDRGALVALTRGLYFLALAEVVRGELEAATDTFAEGRELRTARGDPAGLGAVVVLAWQGLEADARAEAAAVRRESDARSQRGVLVYAEHGLGVLDLALGSYASALGHALEVDAEDSYFLSLLALPDLVEAAARAGDAGAAGEPLDRLESRAAVSGTPLALGLAARARALLADDDTAEQSHTEAVELLGGTRARGHLARAHLLYGEWLRRRKRRREARTQLRLALEIFETMGAATFAERARVELLATGEHARRRSVETTGDLTPQEQQVARLAASGSTNSEIASHLFISASTVDYHLRKVYRKLGISSRRELDAALGDR